MLVVKYGGGRTSRVAHKAIRRRRASVHKFPAACDGPSA